MSFLINAASGVSLGFEHFEVLFKSYFSKQIFHLRYWHNMKGTSPFCNFGKVRSKQLPFWYVSFSICYFETEWNVALSNVPVT